MDSATFYSMHKEGDYFIYHKKGEKAETGQYLDNKQNKPQRKEGISIDKSSYYIGDKKVTLCDVYDEIRKPQIEVDVDNETPLYLIDSLLSNYYTTCTCGDFCISLGTRALWPIEDVVGNEDLVVPSCHNNDEYTIVMTRSEDAIMDLCKRYVSAQDQVKTEIQIRNGNMYINGNIGDNKTKIEDPIKIRLHNGNTFSDLCSVYSFLMKTYAVTQCDELYKNVRICICFDIDELFYEKAIEYLEKCYDSK